MSKISKLLATVTAGGVAAIAYAVFGLDLDPALATAIATVVAGAATYLAPKNTTS